MKRSAPQRFQSFRRIHMNRLPAGKVSLLALLFFLGCPEGGQAANFVKTAHGIQIQTAEGTISLSVASQETFRLTVCPEGATADNPFVDAAAVKSAPEWEVVESNPALGIKNSAGSLMLDIPQLRWSLLGASGEKVIGGVIQKKADEAIEISCEGQSPFKAYGAGDAGAAGSSLAFTDITPAMKNGSFTQPFFWSPDGYGCLAIGRAPGDARKMPVFKAATRIWSFPGTVADFYVFRAATLKEELTAFAHLTGASPVPPRWSLGFLASRWGWEDRAYIEDVLARFRQGHFPVDAFIYDFEWYADHPDYGLPAEGIADFRDFGFNPKLFPEPAKQIADYRARGVHSVMIRKPRLGNSGNISMFQSNNWMGAIKGDEPHQQRDIAFEKPDVRAWWAQSSQPLLEAGIDGWWNDEGERDCTTYYYWNLAERELINRCRKNVRLFSLDRAAFPGTQRTGAAAWTGDISSSWKSLQDNVRKKLLWSLSGQLYSADDIGGFCPPSEEEPLTPELLVRWYQAGAFFPIMRAHSHSNETPRWPWLWGEQAEGLLRDALKRRYQFIPYLYSLEHESGLAGQPIMRPLMLDYPALPGADSLTDQWLFGPNLLVAPILTKKNNRRVVLPDGEWFKWQTAETFSGSFDVTAALDETPVYVKAGTILPLAPVIQSTSELPGGPLQVEIYPGTNATFTLIEDDGETLNYLTGAVRQTVFSWNETKQEVSWKIEGAFKDAHCFAEMTVRVFSKNGIRTSTPAPLGKGGVLSAKDMK